MPALERRTLERRALDRLVHAQGERLRSDDFNDQLAINNQLRWWHDRAVHNAYGIASGFGVREGGGSVGVQPGVAYDRFGRELVLAGDAQVPKPITAPLLLVAYFASPGDTRSAARACPFGGPARPGVTLEWLPAPAPKDGVVIALWDGDNLSQDTPPVTFARVMARPHVATGSSIPGGTAWQTWREGERVLGLTVSVDTSAAGFTQTPCYFAWLCGSLWDPSLLDGVLRRRSPLFAWTVMQGLALHFDHIDQPTERGFLYRVWLPRIPLRVNVAALAQVQKVAVCWIGIDHQLGTRQERGEHGRN
jgi:hypothetical protein